jgi:hypothetical protein
LFHLFLFCFFGFSNGQEGHYIAGERIHSGKKEVEEALSKHGRYQTIRENLQVKEAIVGNGEARKRYVIDCL